MTSSVAVALGACAVEKHLTLARYMKGTDHACSLEPDGLRRIVRDIRNCERALGSGILEPAEGVRYAREKLGRSVVTRVAIAAGRVVGEEMLTLKSPGTGLKWRERDQVVGRRAKRDIPADALVTRDDVE
jgi:sialic acid synthase